MNCSEFVNNNSELPQKPPPKPLFISSLLNSMNHLKTGLSELCRNVDNPGDPLSGIGDRMDTEKNRGILAGSLRQRYRRGEKPNCDPLLMVKIRLLQQ